MYYTWSKVWHIYIFIDRHLALIFYYFFLYTVFVVFVCKFRPQESQSDVLGDLRRMINLVVGSYFGNSPLLFPGLEPASPGTPTVLTRVRCLSLKPDMDREVRSHPDSRISAKVQSWEFGLSRVLRPNHPELRHVSSLNYRLHHQSCGGAGAPGLPLYLPPVSSLQVLYLIKSVTYLTGCWDPWSSSSSTASV